MKSVQLPSLTAGQFRTAILFPGSKEDSVRLEIEVHNLTDKIAYSAISYCWGNGPAIEKCFCGSDSFIEVTETLHEALINLRHGVNETAIWADQICIDQQSTADKSQQVQSMRDIFSQAEQVIVWLGEEDDDSKIVYQLCNTIGNRIEAHFTYKSNIEIDVVSSLRTSEWAAFRRWLSKPWFTRLWPFQEVVLAQQTVIHCGAALLSLQTLYIVCNYIAGQDRAQNSTSSRLGKHSKMVDCMSLISRTIAAEMTPEQHGWRHLFRTLENLMVYAMDKQTSLGHDKVYSVLGLALDIDPREFPVDYQRPLSEVFIHLTKFLINQGRSLTILKLKELSPASHTSSNDLVELPSWVPDYRFGLSETRIWKGDLDRFIKHEKFRLYNATGLSHSRIGVDYSPLLRIKARLIGDIESLSEVPTNDTKSFRIDRMLSTTGTWMALAESCALDDMYRYTGETIHQAYTRLRCADVLPMEIDREDRIKRLQSGSPIPQPPSHAYLQPAYEGQKLSYHNDIAASIVKATTNQRLFITDNLHMGLCDKDCSINDQVWLVMGSDVPYILRRLDTGYFEFKGEAYVHGMMDGEYLVDKFKQRDPRAANVDDESWLDNLSKCLPFETWDLILC